MFRGIHFETTASTWLPSCNLTLQNTKKSYQILLTELNQSTSQKEGRSYNFALQS